MHRSPDPSLHHDQGSALLVAVMSVGVCLAISLLGLQLALTGTRSSGVERQRVLALNAAEAGIDGAYTLISNGGAQPPCVVPATSVRSGPDRATFTTTISYRSADAGPLSCDASGRVVGVPASALIRSSAATNVLAGGSTRGQRSMEARVDLVPAQLLSKAILADGTLDVTNRTTVTGDVGTDADVYSNRSVTCDNNGNFAGSVYSQGDVVISNTCTFAGSVWASGNITTSRGANGSIAGPAKAHRGSIALTGITVSGNLYSSGPISYNGCATAGKCYPNSDPGPPPVTPFPVIRGDTTSLSGWRAAGYSVTVDSDCSGIKARIVSTYARSGTPTLVSTPCRVEFDNDRTIALQNDLALFASGGITSARQVRFTSDRPGTQRLLHWVVPYVPEMTTRPCTALGITTDQQFEFGNDLAVFAYSPCAISISNNGTFTGQIYGGSDVTINNQFAMTYRPVPVHGVDLNSVPPVRFTPSVVYKRETQ